jgi:diguanylate cyclase (GGDEF)-like protein
VLLRTINSLDDAVTVAENIRSALSQPFNLAQQSLDISCSIGIALYPQHAATETEMLEFADIAMYQAKQDGRNRVSVYQHKNS